MPSRMEEMASKGMGLVKEVKATLKGLTGVFKTLSEQHGEVTALLLRLKSTSDPVKRRELWHTVRQELLSHERGELEVVYPLLRREAATRPIAEEHEVDAGQLSSLISQLDGVELTSASWSPLFDSLVRAVEKHVSAEEGDYFPRAQEVIGSELANQIDTQFLAAKKRYMSTLS